MYPYNRPVSNWPEEQPAQQTQANNPYHLPPQAFPYPQPHSRSQYRYGAHYYAPYGGPPPPPPGQAFQHLQPHPGFHYNYVAPFSGPPQPPSGQAFQHLQPQQAFPHLQPQPSPVIAPAHAIGPLSAIFAADRKCKNEKCQNEAVKNVDGSTKLCKTCFNEKEAHRFRERRKQQKEKFKAQMRNFEAANEDIGKALAHKMRLLKIQEQESCDNPPDPEMAGMEIADKKVTQKEQQKFTVKDQAPCPNQPVTEVAHNGIKIQDLMLGYDQPDTEITDKEVANPEVAQEQHPEIAIQMRCDTELNSKVANMEQTKKQQEDKDFAKLKEYCKNYPVALIKVNKKWLKETAQIVKEEFDEIDEETNQSKRGTRNNKGATEVYQNEISTSRLVKQNLIANRHMRGINPAAMKACMERYGQDHDHVAVLDNGKKPVPRDVLEEGRAGELGSKVGKLGEFVLETVINRCGKSYEPFMNNDIGTPDSTLGILDAAHVNQGDPQIGQGKFFDFHVDKDTAGVLVCFVPLFGTSFVFLRVAWYTDYGEDEEAFMDGHKFFSVEDPLEPALDALQKFKEWKDSIQDNKVLRQDVKRMEKQFLIDKHARNGPIQKGGTGKRFRILVFWLDADRGEALLFPASTHSHASCIPKQAEGIVRTLLVAHQLHADTKTSGGSMTKHHKKRAVANNLESDDEDEGAMEAPAEPDKAPAVKKKAEMASTKQAAPAKTTKGCAKKANKSSTAKKLSVKTHEGPAQKRAKKTSTAKKASVKTKEGAVKKTTNKKSNEGPVKKGNGGRSVRTRKATDFFSRIEF